MVIRDIKNENKVFHTLFCTNLWCWCGLVMSMLCGWGGNSRSGIELAVRCGLGGLSTYALSDHGNLEREMSTSSKAL